MVTTIATYQKRARQLDTEGIDFDAFADRPLSPGALRCLRYMHDVEHHTICYLRNLLVTPAHRDPEVTSFLSCWVFEELWHGEALGRVLEAHHEPAGDRRIAGLRDRRRWRDTVTVAAHIGASSLAGASFLALQMTWGAVNEWTTQAGYGRLAGMENHPVLTELLGRIMRQEGRHIDFYVTQATKRLAASPGARRMARAALGRLWRPVGSGVMPDAEVAFLVDHLFADEGGHAVAERIDRRVNRLPGLGDLHLMANAVERASLRTGTDAARRPPAGSFPLTRSA